MMKLSIVFLSVASAVASEKTIMNKIMQMGSSGSVDFEHMEASSRAGQKLINSARKLEDAYDEDYVGQYSIMFDACHNTTTWGENGYLLVPLIRFSLCPTKYIHSGKCFSKGVGEYIVDLTTFMDGYLEYQLEGLQRKCEYLREKCGCDERDDDGCLYHCYDSYSGLSWMDCEEIEEDDRAQLGECQEFDMNAGNDDGRRLADGEEEPEYFMGPYCGPGGKGVFLTLFKDQYCSYPLQGAADLYESLTGSAMPYQYAASSRGMVKRKWVSCAEQDDNGNDDANNQDADRVTEFCEEAYELAGKCETNMKNIYYKNTDACDYIYQLKGRTAYQMSSSYSGVVWGAAFLVSLGLSSFAAIKMYMGARKGSNSRSAPLVEVEMR
mmetsp:Transcript_32816/g.49477  ORF Transcript_32816/g.49477 Transcript_32816/m.49477 type:complete len:381 (+) Transcript_32816:82-1224(+)